MGFSSWFWNGVEISDAQEATALEILSDAPRDPEAFRDALEVMLASASTVARAVALDQYSHRVRRLGDAETLRGLDDRVRRVASEVLHGEPIAHGELPAANHASALRVLAHLGLPEHGARVATILRTTDCEEVLHEALDATYTILVHPGAVSPQLSDALGEFIEREDAPAHARAHAIGAAKQFGRFEAAFARLCDSPVFEVSAAAARALLEIDLDRYRDRVVESTRSWGEATCYDAETVRQLLTV